MISARNIQKQFGDQVLFENASFSLGPRERLGLVGRNGHGKTTLFMMILGKECCDAGEIIIPKEYKIGHLEQTLKCEQATVLAEACLGLPPEEKDDQWKVKKTLSGLGFSESDFERPPTEFSGGYQMRIALARLLVSRPDLLLLDEPTNYLDILSIRWLTGFLRTWPGELIAISHDRAFMDNIITHTMGIHRKSIRKIRGVTKHYYAQIKLEEEVHERRRLNDEKIRKKEEEFINTFRAKARRASQVQSRVKKLAKMDLTDKLENIKSLSFSFNYYPCHAKQLMAATNITFSYDGTEPFLINTFELALRAKDKIGIIGRNGAGKSTLLKLLAGKLTPLTGTIKKHPALQTAYYNQSEAADLNDENTVEQEIVSCLPADARRHARSICGNMLFSGDNALKKISILSGGEKCRVMIGKIIASPANLLMLDEPTHHLDMESCNAMIHAIKAFDGAVLIASHDEYLLREAVTKLIVLQGGTVKLFPGTYDEFLDRIGWITEEPAKKAAENKKTLSKKELRRIKAERTARYNKVINPLKEKTERLEAHIDDLETQHSQATSDMVAASEKQAVPDIIRLNKLLSELEQKIEQAYEDFYQASANYEDKLASLKKEFGGSS
jgi:ATP-binding cassette subfamily F protein 3